VFDNPFAKRNLAVARQHNASVAADR